MKQSLPPGVVLVILIALVFVAGALIYRGATPPKSERPFDMKAQVGVDRVAPPATAAGAPALPGR